MIFIIDLVQWTKNNMQIPLPGLRGLLMDGFIKKLFIFHFHVKRLSSEATFTFGQGCLILIGHMLSFGLVC